VLRSYSSGLLGLVSRRLLGANSSPWSPWLLHGEECSVCFSPEREALLVEDVSESLSPSREVLPGTVSLAEKRS